MTYMITNPFEQDVQAALMFWETMQRSSFIQPEKRLMHALLADAIVCFRKFLAGDKKRKEAYDWLFEDKQGAFSFANVCETLGLEPSYIRRGLRSEMNSKRCL